MPALIRAQPAEQVGAALHDRFTALHESGQMTSPARSAGVIIELISGHATGQIADARNPSSPTAG
jgi:hypothetical protein